MENNVNIIGDYILDRQLGEGSFGVVYEAMEIPTKKLYAAKIISK